MSADIDRARQDGISLTELRRRRSEAVTQMVGPAMRAYRRALRQALGTKR